MPPGRGGPELISCMWRLEQFLATQPELGGVYGRREVGVEVPVEIDDETLEKHPELQPYRPLKADRLKLKGTGDWPIEEYIEGPLWLPYVEPAFLLHGASTKGCPVPVFHREDEEEYFRLAMKWEQLGLLRLHEEPIMPEAFVRVFNAHKSMEVDRMIGDRRRINYMERHFGGPSSELPAGPMLVALHLRRGQCLHSSVTDRRDFYHQCFVSRERSATNLVPFSFPVEQFCDTKALEEFNAAFEDERLGGREEHGDRLGLPKKQKRAPPERLYPSFGALYQGDRLGVEFALSGHQGLLGQEGLLPEEERVRGKRILPRGPVWRALIIDDFFVISREDERTQREETRAYRILAKAREAYRKHQLPGSPEKDVLSQRLFKAAGAEVDSRSEATMRRLTLVSAPLSKRLGLSAVSLRVAGLPYVTPSLMARLSGSWVSVLLYRRCLASVAEEMFSLGNFKDETEGRSLVRLPKKVSSELGVLAALSPMMSSNAMADYEETLYATDASMTKGAIVKTEVSKEISAALWQGGDRQGHYTMLDNNFAGILSHLGEEREDEAEVEVGTLNPEKERPFVFDFVEVFGGVGAVSQSMVALGMVVAPVLDITWSKKYNISSVRLLEWFLFMLDQRRFRSALLAPPCTSFSPAAHPAVRSYSQPKGFNRKHPKVIHGNIMAFRALVIMRHAVRRRIPSLLEQPRLSKMAWLSAWRWLLSLGCEEAVIAACQFESPHRKEFRLLCYALDAERMTRKCGGGHTHIPIAGKFTAPSAIYTPAMAMHLAVFFKRAVRMCEFAALDEEPVSGKESIITNDLLLSRTWRCHRDWWWKKRSHINVLEAGAVENLIHELAESEEDVRCNICVDSMVAKGAIAKGRSSSFSLQPTLRRSAAYQVAGGVFPSISFSPTRWNPADAPTREKTMPPPVPHSILEKCSEEEIRTSHSYPLPRPYANWVRLSLILIAVSASPATSEPISPCAPGPQSLTSSYLGFSYLLPSSSGLWCCVHYLIPCVTLIWSLTLIACLGHKASLVVRPLGAVVFFSLLSHVAAPLVPQTAAEQARADNRAGIKLASDRLVRRQTRDSRIQLLMAFEHWLWEEHGVSWETVFGRTPLDAEEISNWLSRYGREMHESGKAYGKFAETINAVAMSRPILKRQLGGAWDVCFAWLMDEPYEHHPAMPVAILVGIVTTALLWGWPREAAVFSLGWAGLLRVGEIIGMKRRDLVLPTDAAPGTSHILANLKEPKTRGRGARHQAAKIEAKDLVVLISAVFQRFSADQPLWNLSSATLRRRFSQLLSAIGIASGSSHGARGYDLASLRPGGATHLLNITENSELVRRRGRWASTKVMDIYLQEIAVATGLMKLSMSARERVDRLCAIYPEVLQISVQYLNSCIPCTAWTALFRHQQRRG